MDVRGAKPPHQRRSAETLHRILDAVEQLLPRAGSLDEVSLNELCAVAEVSRSSFYARFDSKEALIPALCDRLYERSRLVVEDAVLASLEPQSVREVTSMILRSHLEFQRSIEILAPHMVDHPQVTAVRLRSTRLATEGVSELIARVRQRPPTPSEDERLLFLVCVAGSSLRSGLTPPQQWIQLFGWTDDQLVQHYVELCLGYLGLDPDAPVPGSG